MFGRPLCARPRTARLAAAALLVALPSGAHAQSVKISGLSDLSFGTLATSGDPQMSESLCADRLILNAGYSITANGSGAANAFTLANGSVTLPYEVQWSASAGQTSGTNLRAGVALTGQNAALICSLTGIPDASLTVIIRGTQIAAARAGTYSGTLTLILSAN